MQYLLIDVTMRIIPARSSAMTSGYCEPRI